MKRLMIIVCSIMVMAGAYANSNICRKSNTVVILMSKSTNGSGSATVDAAAKTWSVPFSYATLSVGSRTLNVISGNAACNGLTGTANTVDSSVRTTSADVGVNCWCEMMLPAHSYWTYVQQFNSDAACDAGCATACANAISTSQSFRTGIFGGIW